MTKLLLKSVYFDAMELKTLFYIAIGIIWLISKFLQADKGKQVQLPRKPVPPAPESFPETPNLPEALNTPKRKLKPAPVLKRTTKPTTSLPDEKVVNYENYFLSSKPLFSEEAVMQEVQILEKLENSGNTVAGQLHEEIRNGTFDWKRAVVINELLKQQHFR